tara:strand:- start:141 stop:410 length:270 start_codon:yes stop_codon:yes gene_type:complete
MKALEINNKSVHSSSKEDAAATDEAPGGREVSVASKCASEQARKHEVMVLLTVFARGSRVAIAARRNKSNINHVCASKVRASKHTSSNI